MDAPFKNVSDSPVTPEQNWAKIAEAIGILCFQLSLPKGASDWIRDDMKPRCLSTLGSMKLPDIPTNDIARATVARIGVPFQERADRLLAEMMRLEFELYAERFLPRRPDVPEMKEKIRRTFAVIEGGKTEPL
jgi:hypothetical protein